MYTKESIHVERILFDNCFWEENVVKAKLLFETGVLPELLGRWFSRPPEQVISHESSPHSSTDDVPSVSTLDTKYCYCRGDEYGEMVGCDNDECPYQWFHLDCLQLKSPPKSKVWYCPDCCKLEKFKKRKNISRQL